MSLEDLKHIISSSEKPVFVMFTADFCLPCKQLKPKFEEESKQNTKSVFIQVDYCPEIFESFGVKKIPTVKSFFGGKHISDMLVGQELSKFVESVESKYLS